MKLVCGVGVNDANYNIVNLENGKKKTCVFYTRWANMMHRCYNKKTYIRWPNYVGCSVDERWHHFTTFKKWMESQDWQGKSLDKDILFEGNKVYGPETCVFVSQSTNNFLTDAKAGQGEYPIGVTKIKNNRFNARCTINGKSEHIGCFKTPEEAHQAWYNVKRNTAIELASQQTDPRVADALISRFP